MPGHRLVAQAQIGRLVHRHGIRRVQVLHGNAKGLSRAQRGQRANARDAECDRPTLNQLSTAPGGATKVNSAGSMAVTTHSLAQREHHRQVRQRCVACSLIDKCPGIATRPGWAGRPRARHAGAASPSRSTRRPGMAQTVQGGQDRRPRPVPLGESRAASDHGYRFTELWHGLHCDFARVTHTVSGQRFGAGRGEGEKNHAGEPPRCRPLSLFGKTMTWAHCDCDTVGLRPPTPRALSDAKLRSSSARP